MISTQTNGLAGDLVCCNSMYGNEIAILGVSLMSFDPDKPYNDLPLLPPKAELETKAVLRKVIAAKKALAELKGAGGFGEGRYVR